MLKTDASSRVHLTITEKVTAYDDCKIIRDSWYLVPKRVVLKAWLKKDIYSPPQHQDNENFLEIGMATQEPEMHPQFGSSSQREVFAVHARIVADLERGLEWT